MFQPKRIPIVLILLGVSALFRVSAQEKEDLMLYNNWQYYGDVSNTLYTTLSQRAFKQLEDRDEAISRLHTAADWEGYQKQVRRKLNAGMGEFPRKTPLNPIVTGVIRKDGVRIEKLYFESLPNYYVTAALFIPEHHKGRLPAILYCSGHGADGFRSEVYQQAILNYVKKGFVVLAFDPIGQGERIQYLDSLGHSTFGSTGEHSYPGTQLFLSGRSPAYYFIWDGIRAIDYLLTRPEIDGARIGLTGRSGGGTQTAFIAAYDDRIKAYAPECYVTSFGKLLRSVGPTDAEQNLVGALYDGIEIADILAVSAPKPLMIISTTQDYFSIQGARDAYRFLQNMYQAYGKKDNVAMAEDDAKHASTKKNRESAYRFFQKHLSNPGSDTDEKVTLLSKEELNVTPDGNIYKLLPGHDLFSLSKAFSEEIFLKKAQGVTNGSLANRNIREEIIKHSGYEKHLQGHSSVFSGRFHRSEYAVEKYLVKGPGDYHIPLLWFKPENSNCRVVLLLDENGKGNAGGDLADSLAKEGYEVVIPDLVGIGELGGGYNRGSAFIQNVPLNVWYLGVLTKMSPVSLRMGEIQLLSDFIRSGKKPCQKISVIGQGALCTDVLYSALLDPGFEEIFLLDPLISYRSILSEKYYKTKYILSSVPGAAANYDLPDLIKIVAPVKIFIYNPVDAKGFPVDSNLVMSAYSDAINEYKIKGKMNNVSIRRKDYNSLFVEVSDGLKLFLSLQNN